jgi:UDP-N-acetylglucosamine 2-epimerase (non-hydrolysing)
VKVAPVVARLRERTPAFSVVVLHTGQHYGDMMSNVFFEGLGVLEPDYMLGTGSGSHAAQAAPAMERLEPVVEIERQTS